ncbi:hypothetical protein ACHAXS_003677 [Conticribra weissflogii]
MNFIRSFTTALILLIGTDANEQAPRRLRQPYRLDSISSNYPVLDINYDWARVGQDALDVGKDNTLIREAKALKVKVTKAGKKVLPNHSQRNLQRGASDSSTTEIKYDWERVRKDAIDALGKSGFILEANEFDEFSKAGKKKLFQNNDQSNQSTLNDRSGKSGKSENDPTWEISKSSKVAETSMPASSRLGQLALSEVSGKAVKGKRAKLSHQ